MGASASSARARDASADDVAAAVTAELGKAFTPARVLFVSALPKTRSAKIVRRAVRARALGLDPGDLSTVENPESLDEIAVVVAMRIGVVGAGGVGGFFGARLAQAGADVAFLARGPHLDAIREHGLRVRRPGRRPRDARGGDERRRARSASATRFSSA